MNYSTKYMYKDLIRKSPLQKRVTYLVVDAILTARNKDWTHDMSAGYLRSELQAFMRERKDLYKYLIHSAYIMNPHWINWVDLAQALIRHVLQEQRVGEFFNEETREVAQMVHYEDVAVNFADLLGKKTSFRPGKLGHILQSYKALGFGCKRVCYVDNRMVDWVGAAQYFKRIIDEGGYI